MKAERDYVTLRLCCEGRGSLSYESWERMTTL
jgi:hypothetical protein